MNFKDSLKVFNFYFYNNSNIGFTNNKRVLVKNLFGCTTKVNVKLSYSTLTDAKACEAIGIRNTRENSGTGPFIVCSQSHLNAIDDSAANLKAHYVIYQNINFNNQIFNSISGTFTGTFDGRGHKIQNLRALPNPSLFSNIGSGGMVKNFSFENITNLTLEYVGTISGFNGVRGVAVADGKLYASDWGSSPCTDL